MSDAEQVRNSKPRAAESTPRTRLDFPVVAVGASAGGLEACTALLKSMPANLGMAFVVIPHLDPNRTSAFPEILARSTSMKIVEVEDGTVPSPNSVYVIPRKCDMTIQHGALRITHRQEQRPVNTTIDTFMRSLALDQ